MTSDDNTKPLTIGNIPTSSPRDLNLRINLLLWGPSGAGKTVLASTMPGRKLWLQFDPGGTASISERDDIIVLDLAGQANDIVMRFREPDPMSLTKFITENEISTIVIDSITAFQEMAMSHGVAHASRTKQHAGATLEDPGFGGYGRRKTWTMMLVMNILAVGAKTGTHTCFISHEDSPTKNDKGDILYIGMLLGSDLPDKAGLQMSEIWNLVDTGTQRTIMVRPARMKKPLKTRMFLADVPEFAWKYDQNKPNDANTIAAWFEQWKNNQFRKIPLPK